MKVGDTLLITQTGCLSGGYGGPAGNGVWKYGSNGTEATETPQPAGRINNLQELDKVSFVATGATGSQSSTGITFSTVVNDVDGSNSPQILITIEKAPTTTTVTCPSSVTYSGLALTPCSATVTGAGGLSLTPTPTYSNNTYAGTATAGYTYAGNSNYEGSNDSKNFTISVATGSVNYTGTNTVPEGSRINLTASTNFTPACANLSLYQYQYSSDETTWNPFDNEGDIIQKPMITLAPDVYFVRVVYNGASDPDPNCGTVESDSVILTVYATGSNAYGGGFYTIPGAGKANFGFVVQKVAKTTNTFKGQVLWNFKENWRFKGTLDNFGKGLDGTTPIGTASGTGILQEWDESALEGLGDWVTAESGVNVILKFTATTASSKKSPGNAGSFAINFSYIDPSLPLPNNLLPLKGGNIKYS